MLGAARALEFYSGIGGLHLALSRSSVDGSVVRAFDWDQLACQVYAANHGRDAVERIDISTLTAEQLASHHADLWLMSPSCQPYTVLNPAAKGAADPRARSFLHLIETVLPALAALGAQPGRLLVENVAGFETSSTRDALRGTLRRLGYVTCELLLTPLQFGVPNSRLRYYMLARTEPFSNVSAGEDDKVWRHIPGYGEDWVDPRGGSDEGVVNEVSSIARYLDGDGVYPLHAVPERVLEKWGRLFDIVLPSSARTCCFTRGYTQLVERSGSILQENEALDTTETFYSFLHAQASGRADAVSILYPLRLRYLSPSELLRLFSFEEPQKPDSFIWPRGVSTKSKYRLIGNSINVYVVTELIKFLFR
ncbi:S-adenosyl-L-methionine-dependent methyltransferase [Auriscalpium vulgare]|uniref:S-adenosyl-L-methionine-dependent methyltransferase n=1 Tax=Auriscalpium vulgare TaxID=40419 RepID=A0ACB8RQB8_9AGAM|nr:S-adenosyl-L-methionine-dependent methyltransferase [Auriscalpium vulgare]